MYKESDAAMPVFNRNVFTVHSSAIMYWNWSELNCVRGQMMCVQFPEYFCKLKLFFFSSLVFLIIFFEIACLKMNSWGFLIKQIIKKL